MKFPDWPEAEMAQCREDHAQTFQVFAHRLTSISPFWPCNTLTGLVTGMLWHLQKCSSSSASREAGISVPTDFHEKMVCFQLFRHHTLKGKRLASTQNLSPWTITTLRYAIHQDSCSPEAIFSSSQADFTPPHSPHCVEVIIRRHIVFIITGQTQLVPITLVDKVPELLWTERLKERTENSTHFHLRILKYSELLELLLSGLLHALPWKEKW